MKVGGDSRIQQDIVCNVDRILQPVANLAKFGLRKVFDDSVEEEYEVLPNPKGGRRRNNEDVVGCVCHGVADGGLRGWEVDAMGKQGNSGLG